MGQLECEVLESVFKVNGDAFSKLVQEVYGQEDYWISADELLNSGDVILYEGISGVHDNWGEGRITEFKDRGHYNHLARTLLEDLCKEGYIEPGDYLINAH